MAWKFLKCVTNAHAEKYSARSDLKLQLRRAIQNKKANVRGSCHRKLNEYIRIRDRYSNRTKPNNDAKDKNDTALS